MESPQMPRIRGDITELSTGLPEILRSSGVACAQCGQKLHTTEFAAPSIVAGCDNDVGRQLTRGTTTRSAKR